MLILFSDARDLWLRDARDKDCWELIGLIAACWAEYPGLVLDVHGEAPWLRTPATAYTQRGGRLWVVETAGRIVASAGFVPSAEPGGIELRTLYVAHAARGQGVGGQLVEFVECEAWQRGMAFVDLWTDAKFLDAQRLYERRGYRRGDTRTLQDLSRSVEYYYRKELAPVVWALDGTQADGATALVEQPAGA